ncbi:MAG: deoxyribonuclease IV, partial [Planctomycetota bacterium]
MKTAKRKKNRAGPLVGAHMSIVGGVWRAFGRLADVGGNALQVFLKNNVQWRFPRLTDEAFAKFAEERERTGISTVAAHACYLVNLATSDRKIRRKSIAELSRELEYARRYGIPWVVLHAGNHMGAGVTRGIANVARALRAVLEKADGPGILVETTAGAGTAVGSRFEEIAEIIHGAGGGARLGVCLDTSHIFAAGYDVSSEEGYRKTKSALRRLGLLKLVKVIH